MCEGTEKTDSVSNYEILGTHSSQNSVLGLYLSVFLCFRDLFCYTRRIREIAHYWGCTGMANFAKAFGKAKYHSKATTLRGRKVGSGSTMHRFTGPSFKAKVDFRFPLHGFLKQVNQKERKVLNQTGSGMRHLYRGVKHGFGVWHPDSKRGKAKKFTKTGRLTAAYKRAMDRRMSMASRPPMSKRGTLRDLTFYVVNYQMGNVVCGPALFDKTTTKSNKAVPRLLDEGGTANVVTWRATKGGGYRKKGAKRLGRVKKVRRRVQYRQFPYRMNIRNLSAELYKRKLRDIPLV